MNYPVNPIELGALVKERNNRKQIEAQRARLAHEAQKVQRKHKHRNKSHTLPGIKKKAFRVWVSAILAKWVG